MPGENQGDQLTRFVESTITFPYKRSLGPVVGAFMTALTEKQILAVETEDAVDANTLLAATATLDASVIGDTILVLTTTDGDDGFIYTNM